MFNETETINDVFKTTEPVAAEPTQQPDAKIMSK